MSWAGQRWENRLCPDCEHAQGQHVRSQEPEEGRFWHCMLPHCKCSREPQRNQVDGGERHG